MINEDKWLITVDLDGTTLGNPTNGKDYVIPQYNIQVLKKLQDLGHKVAIVTGRPWRDAKKIYEEMDLDTIIANYNGALISHPKDKGFVPTQSSINREILSDLLAKKEYKANIKNVLIEYEEHSSMLDKEDKKLQTIFHIKNDETLQKYEWGMEIETNPFSCTLRVEADKDTRYELLYSLRREFGNSLLFRYWEMADQDIYALEINQKAIDKSSAMKYIASYYNIPAHRTIALGDGLNDTEMLTEAAVGVAMNNARNIVKRYANDVTDETNDNAGVGKYLEEFFNIKEK